jgi:hypothetical protein
MACDQPFALDDESNCPTYGYFGIIPMVASHVSTN